MSLRPNFLLAAAAWRTRCLVSRDAAINFNWWTADWPVHFRRIILVVWEDVWELTVVSCTVITSPSVERRWPPSSRSFETLESVRTSGDAVSTFRPDRRWPLMFIATYTVATSPSVNRKWHHHNSPNRATLTTGVHCVEPFRHRRPGALIRQLAKSRNRWYANCRQHCFDC